MPENNQLLPKSIEMRAIAHMEKGTEAIEALRLAIEEENNTIWLCMGVDMKTGQYKRELANEIQSTLCKRVYDKIHTNK